MEMRTISTETELAELLDASRERPVLLFKHSNACPISGRAHDEVESFLADRTEGDFDFGMIVVQTARALSNKVEADFGIEHESPQAIVFRGGKPTWNASHGRINARSLGEALAAA